MKKIDIIIFLLTLYLIIINNKKYFISNDKSNIIYSY